MPELKGGASYYTPSADDAGCFLMASISVKGADFAPRMLRCGPIQPSPQLCTLLEAALQSQPDQPNLFNCMASLTIATGESGHRAEVEVVRMAGHLALHLNACDVDTPRGYVIRLAGIQVCQR
jgi:hypothetical protein